MTENKLFVVRISPEAERELLKTLNVKELSSNEIWGLLRAQSAEHESGLDTLDVSILEQGMEVIQF